MTFVTRAKARSYLQGRWYEAIAVQGILLVPELILLLLGWWLKGAYWLPLFCALLIDVLMISPLKAGRAFFFETLTADSSAASVRLLFRYYRHGYERTIGWRLLLWGWRVILNTLLCLPALFLFAYSHLLAENAVTRSDNILSMAMLGCGLLMLLIGLVITELLLCRLVAVPYLLSHTGSLREAVSLSRRITKGRIGVLVSLYLDHAGWLFALPLFFPWFYTSSIFQTARAATLRRFLQQIPKENTACVLQHQKKYGRIGR